MPSLKDSLYDLRIRLLITPEQAPVWERFHAAFINLDDLSTRTVSAGDEGRALAAIQQVLIAAQNRSARVEDLANSTRALYAVLSPDQQRSINDLLPALLREFTRPGHDAHSAAAGARE